MISRRKLLASTIALALPVRLQGQEPQEADRLRDPAAVGRQRDSLTALDNNPVIIAIERRLRCTCECTLDVYTCRTTDFTCTYSPAMHREIMDLYSAGQDPESIIAVFVAREGEKILMAPPAEGFNVAGYVVPGAVMLTGIVGLVAWVSRRRDQVSLATGPGAAVSADPPVIDDAKRDELRKALEAVDD
jgi:cytochrome c-type biogenesis protein CcmH/NrfF